MLRYLDELDAESDDDIITVVIPEFVTSMGTQWLHNQSALSLKVALLYRPHTVVVSVPIHVDVKEGRTEEVAVRTETSVTAPAAENDGPGPVVFDSLKRVLIGRPIATSEEGHHRLRKLVALPVFASDAISSTAYATEEIILVLVPVTAMAAFNYVVPIADPGRRSCC